MIPEYTLPNGSIVACMNPGETEIIYREIFSDQIYARHGIEFCDDDTILDIGANIGLFAMFVNQLCERVNLYCFEPAPATFEALRQNVARLGQDKMRVFNAAIAGSRGTATLHYMPHFTVSSTLRPDDSSEQTERNQEFTINALATSPNRLIATLYGSLPQFIQRPIARAVMRAYDKKEAIPCQCWSVSDVIRDQDIQKIDLLKLDAEGAEDEILEGIEAGHWPLIKQLAVEVHRGRAQLESIERLLRSKGFETCNDASPESPAEPMVYARRAIPASKA